MNADDQAPRSRARFEITIRTGKHQHAHALDDGRAWCLGRSRDCAIVIADPSVSRRHALLHLNGGRVEVEDLGSSNGTWLLSGTPLAAAPLLSEQRLVAFERTRLRVGEALRVGQTSIQLSWLGPAAPHKGPREGALSPVVVDPAMHGILELVTRAARRDVPVLLLGETGVGKALLAEVVHRCSARAERPFVSLSCAALPEAVLERELFGRAGGASPGADPGEAGLLEQGGGGSVFLDEIGDLPLAVQAKLLGVLERRMLLRLGSEVPRPIDVRLVAASSRDLLAEVRAGQFRADLYHRISGLSVRVPPLRERPSEIEPLARHFVEQLARRPGEPAPDLTEGALHALQKHFWPGNVRELRTVIERATSNAEGGVIEARDIAIELGSRRPEPHPSGWDVPTRVEEVTQQTFRRRTESEERARVVAALEACAGNQRRAAELLGISRRTLVNRLNKWNLPRPKKLPSAES